MSYVDLNGNVRWPEADQIERNESIIRSSVTHTREHVLLRRCVAMLCYVVAPMLPADHPLKPLLAGFGQAPSPAAVAELAAAAMVFLQADPNAAEAKADADRLDLALDYEEARAALAVLADRPHPPRTDFPDGAAGDAPYAAACADVDAANLATADARAAARVAPQAVVNAASADTLALVASRDAHRASLLPPAA